MVIPDEPLHIMHRGNNRQEIFFTEDDYLRFQDDVKRALDQYECNLHAYVLMTNHFHFLLSPHSNEDLSRFMQALGRRYVRYINQRHQRSGTLWEGRFKSSLIDSERYLLACYRYIEENPVRANMVDTISGYRWSSYRANALGQSDKLITPHRLYQALGHDDRARKSAYQGLFLGRLKSSLVEGFQQSVERGEAFGAPEYHANMGKLLGRDTQLGQHGGDRKSDAFRKHEL